MKAVLFALILLVIIASSVNLYLLSRDGQKDTSSAPVAAPSPSAMMPLETHPPITSDSSSSAVSSPPMGSPAPPTHRAVKSEDGMSSVAAEDPSSVAPLAFASTVAMASLDVEQSSGVEVIANDFCKKVGRPPIWSEDPAYRARWESARQEADQRLRLLLGSDLYNTHAEALLKGMSNTAGTLPK